MIRLLVIVCLSLAAFGADEHAGHSEAKEDPNKIWWKWANFAVLAGGLGYLAVKNLKPAFAAKQDEIRRALEAGSIAKAEAEKAAAAIDAKLNNISNEIADIRDRGFEDLKREVKRIDDETLQIVAKMNSQTEAEVERLKKQAVAELRSYSALLAIELAEDRIKHSCQAPQQDALVSQFVQNLEKTH
jgi:F-type H+-transporting ATPase subunit b